MHSHGNACMAWVQFLQAAHPPARKYNGRTPRVHQGFLATWQSNGFHRRVLAHIGALLESAEDRGAVRVLCTGHSLGGAVAQLASFDIARDLGVSPRQISVYTYGCPRIGNHALAREFQVAVPDTWHIINDNDVVTRGMKVCAPYPSHLPATCSAPHRHHQHACALNSSAGTRAPFLPNASLPAQAPVPPASLPPWAGQARVYVRGSLRPSCVLYARRSLAVSQSCRVADLPRRRLAAWQSCRVAVLPVRVAHCRGMVAGLERCRWPSRAPSLRSSLPPRRCRDVAMRVCSCSGCTSGLGIG